MGKEYDPIPEELDRVANQVIGAAIEVHRHLGPGLLESVYQKALCHELKERGLKFRTQVPVKVRYKDLLIEGQRLDLVVEPGLIVELKAVERLHPAHEGQLLSYLKSTGLRLGLLMNFHSRALRQSLRRLIN